MMTTAALLMTAGTAIGTGALWPASAAAPVYGNATTYQINSEHSGLASGSALPTTLKKTWIHDFGGTVSYPVIAGGRLFVTVSHAGTEPYGSNLYAFNAKTGKQLWGPIDLGGTYYVSYLTYTGGRVFTLTFDGQVQAFDAKTGALAWTTQLPGQYAFTSPLTAYGDSIYTGGAGSGGTVYAVDAATGTVKWTNPVANGDNSSPAVNSSGVYVSYACQTAYRFSLAGTLVWNHSTDCSGGGGATPVLHDKQVWIRDGARGPIVLSRATGQPLAITFQSATPPAFLGNRAFLTNNGVLSAVDATTGAALWSSTGDVSTPISAPVISGNRVYIGNSTGKVLAFNASTGKRVWSGSVGVPIYPPNEFGAGQLQALAIGGGVLAVPADTRLTVFG